MATGSVSDAASGSISANECRDTRWLAFEADVFLLRTVLDDLSIAVDASPFVSPSAGPSTVEDGRVEWLDANRTEAPVPVACESPLGNSIVPK